MDDLWATLRDSQLLSPCIRAWMNPSTLTLRALGRNHVVSTAVETIAKAFVYWNRRILLFRSSSEDVCSSALGKIREAFLVHNCHLTRMHSTTRGVKQLASSSSLKRGGQKDDEEVFSETCQNSSALTTLGQLFVRKVRSSRHSCVLVVSSLWRVELYKCVCVFYTY